ncbi:MAG: isoprenylcysteine carboxyl methyltransferase family protein [Omnitrophica WOR_2 bacterium]
MVTRKIFALFVVTLALQRLLELRLSRRNEKRILSQGGQEYFPGQLRGMKFLHAAWLAGMLAEVFALRRPFIPILAGMAALIFGAGQALRYAAIRSLGWRWTVRVMAVPGDAPVEHGIYRYIRHPNYLGVALEIAAAPLLHGAYWTSAVFSILNALILSQRIHTEEQVLNTLNGYETIFRGRKRFIPRISFMWARAKRSQ